MKTISKRFLVMLAALVVLISSIGILSITSIAADENLIVSATIKDGVTKVKKGEKFVVTYKMENYAAAFTALGGTPYANYTGDPLTDGKVGRISTIALFIHYDMAAFTPSPQVITKVWDDTAEDYVANGFSSVTKPLLITGTYVSYTNQAINAPGDGTVRFVYLSSAANSAGGGLSYTTQSNLFQVEFEALSDVALQDYDFTIDEPQSKFVSWKQSFAGVTGAIWPRVISPFTMQINNPVDKTDLESAIMTATLLLGNATEGYDPTEFYPTACDAFEAAIGLAQDVFDDTTATALDVSTAEDDLAAAQLAFTDSEITTENADNDDPTITSVGGNVSVWQKDDVTLAINATDEGCGLATDAYSFDNGLTWQPGNTRMFSSNQNVTVQVRDNRNNIATQVVSISKIDKSFPTITNVTGNSDTWTATKTLIVDADDTISGISQYSFDGGLNWQTGSTKVYTANEDNIFIKVKDLAQNITDYSTDIDIIKIDGTAPTITDVTSSANGWQNTDVTLTVIATDPALSSGGLLYSFGNDIWQSENTKTYTTNTNNITVKVKDAVGNTATYVPVINITEIDTTEPTVSVSVSGNPSIWQNTPVTITVTATDVNGSGGLQYKFGNDAWQSGNTKSYAANTSNITIMVKDAAGNEVTYATDIDIENIDTLVPTITDVTGNADEWQKTDVTLTVNASDTGDSDIYMYSFDNGATWQDEHTKVFSANASVNVKVKDAAGNISTATVVQITKIDKDGPVVTVAGNPTAWQATNVTLTVNATDAGSGILAEMGYSFDNGVTWQDSKDLIFTANKSDIKILVKDNLGNISAVTVVNITMIDKTAPTITVSGNPSAKVASAVLTIGSSADLSGKTITVSKDGGAAVTITGTTYTVTANGSYLFTITNGAGATQTSTVVVTNISATTPIPATGNNVNNGILALMILLSGAALTIFAKKKGAFRTK